MDYGIYSPDDSWTSRAGEEFAVADPLQFSPDTLGHNMTSSAVQGTLPSRPRTSTDPFEVLPNEILHEICRLMPGRDLRAYLSASSTAYFATVDQGFWKALCASRMPWAWECYQDLYQPHTQSTESEVDYKRLYLLLDKNTSSGFGMPPSMSWLLGLANRRRIWNAYMEELLPEYNRVAREIQAGSKSRWFKHFMED